MSEDAGSKFMQRRAAEVEQTAAKDKLDQYRSKALKGDDAIFDSERGVFHFHAKHDSLVGVEAVVTVDLPSLLLAMSVVLQTTVVPILTGQLKVKPVPTPTGPKAGS